ncbi:hypothetical protein F8388_016581 [Cannabis sativa]|uniref:Eukaryotic translation initiation factor 3 subunit E N-terminal domain-containing protein n=1 Tax=Cannabis sativa TaxID=3483 RepID=A0A7J6EYD4_CANSA|nr:hypothetical protein F8388_016581 [Cannabis sativa]
MAEYDLNQRIAPNLDRHLILKSKIELLNNTNMVDYAMDIHKSLYQTEDVPQASIRPNTSQALYTDFSIVGPSAHTSSSTAIALTLLEEEDEVDRVRLLISSHRDLRRSTRRAAAKTR